MFSRDWGAGYIEKVFAADCSVYLLIGFHLSFSARILWLLNFLINSWF